eukprot:gb/GEZJ01005206.1/.p2 GENE.gb/GEZJ01005206.1/~~gb/GEZJ01005206.1/.p2  ORF type:complete len:120 (+),score=5.05 gb/GEZJ01005206.1/:1230-1589(+)
MLECPRARDKVPCTQWDVVRKRSLLFECQRDSNEKTLARGTVTEMMKKWQGAISATSTLGITGCKMISGGRNKGDDSDQHVQSDFQREFPREQTNRTEPVAIATDAETNRASVPITTPK